MTTNGTEFETTTAGLLSSPMLRPEYAERFRCIGPACEDTCCRSWAIFFDEATCHKYEALPESPLRSLIDVAVVREEARPGRDASLHFARVKLGTDKSCPMMDGAGSCRIHAELGEDYLSVTCATYPRIKHRIDGLEEKALSLSCPEAARLVLLTPGLLAVEEGPRYEFRWADGMGADAGGAGRVSLLGYFWPIREFVLKLLMYREYALWQRLFLVGMFCRRLEAFARGEIAGSFSDLRRDFAAAAESGMLRTSMDALPADLELQLDLVLRLGGLKLSRSFVGQRFLDVVEAFKQGIGFRPEATDSATMETLIAGYGEAHARWFAPFFEERPHILENLLMNTVFRTLFPFGQRPGELMSEPDMGREFALLVAHFALLKGVLIGVAGARAAEFSEEDVVWTVQATSKHFEHHPQFLEEAYGLLKAQGLDSMRGLVMLVRN